MHMINYMGIALISLSLIFLSLPHSFFQLGQVSSHGGTKNQDREVRRGFLEVRFQLLFEFISSYSPSWLSSSIFVPFNNTSFLRLIIQCAVRVHNTSIEFFSVIYVLILKYSIDDSFFLFFFYLSIYLTCNP